MLLLFVQHLSGGVQDSSPNLSLCVILLLDQNSVDEMLTLSRQDPVGER